MRSLKRSLLREIKKHRISTLPTWDDAILQIKTFQVQPAVIHKDRRYPAGPRVALHAVQVQFTDQRDQGSSCSRFFGNPVHPGGWAITYDAD